MKGFPRNFRHTIPTYTIGLVFHVREILPSYQSTQVFSHENFPAIQYTILLAITQRRAVWSMHECVQYHYEGKANGYRMHSTQLSRITIQMHWTALLGVYYLVCYTSL
jgi:hypothetical protein